MKAKVSDIEPLIEKYKGNIAAIARHFGVSRGTIYNRIETSSNLQSALADARETMIDNAESALYKKIMDGDTTAIIFFLKTQGKNRGAGYSQRQELTGAHGGPLNVDVREMTDDELRAIADA